MHPRNASVMKRYLALFLSISIISCHTPKDIDSGNSSINTLYKLENELYSNSSAALDSILVFDKTSLDKKSIAYSNLLYAIAYEQKYGVFRNDFLICNAAQEFNQRGDNYNYGRALLYAAIAQYSNKDLNPEAYDNIGKAEFLFKQNKQVDNNFGAILYLYLGRFYRSNSNPEMAHQALEKSLEFSKNASNKNATLNAHLELFNLKLIDKEYGDAIKTIACFGDEVELPGHIEYAFNNAMYNYYSAKKEPTIAIEYLKKMLQVNSGQLKINTNRPKTYYLLATLFKRINMPDSSLYYAQAAVNSIADSCAQDSHFYYKYLADIFYSQGDYVKASNLYKSAHLSYIVSFTKFSQQRDIEVKAKFNFEELKKQENSLKSQRNLLLNFLFILTALFILISLSYFFYFRKNSEITTRLANQLKLLNKEFKKSWLISEIYKSTSYILPQLIDNVYQESTRSRKISKEIYYSLNKIIDSANSASRASLTDITIRDEFVQIFGGIYNIDSLTDFEKLVYALNEEGYSNLEIAHFLNSSEASIRTIKGKISRKKLRTEVESDTEI